MNTKRKKGKVIEWILEGLLLVVLLFMALNMVYSVDIIQGNARVVNYAGIVRGATQRLVKLEISNMPNDELIEYLDVILDELQYGGTTYILFPLEDDEYMAALSEVAETWEQVKNEIYKTRELGKPSPDILELSETYFFQADEMVDLAEAYSDGEAALLWYMEKIMTILIAVLLFIVIAKSISAMRLAKKNRELEKISRMDANTGLPNKGYCEEILSKYGILEPEIIYGCVMFDLNNLKKVNDKWGHKAGDELIKSFANILAACAGARIFVGRYGGDEFIAVMKDATEEAIKDFTAEIERVVEKYNEKRMRGRIEYACGFVTSDLHNVDSMYELLAQADQEMYKDKARKKGLP